MKLKEETWDECSSCGHRTHILEEAQYGCDNCKRVLNMELDEGEYDFLRLTVFRNGSSIDYQFCCWNCVLKFLPKIKSDYFVSLPYLLYDNKRKGMRAKDFLKLVKK